MTGETVLIVEDDTNSRLLLQKQLSELGYEVTSASTGEQALKILEETPQNLTITELCLPGISGMGLLRQIAKCSRTDVVILTAFGTVQSAVEAMKAGAYDYLIKPVRVGELRSLVRRALIHQHKLVEGVGSVPSMPRQDNRFGQIIGSSSTLQHVLDLAARVAPTDATILIRGETGTGKELVARAIHLQSARHDRSFVTVNCAAIPSELLESELFGHTKGSFTGAHAHKQGRVEIADHGTLFLDEIGEMPLALQARILRLLQEHEIEKIGAAAATKVDVRIIAATHRNLEAMVTEGTFREDLYFRLLVVPLDLPPLREREGDIVELVQHFFEKYTLKYGRSDLRFPADLIPRLSSYGWPGNVRQLENTIERLVLLSERSEISLSGLPDALKAGHPRLELLPPNLPGAGINIQVVEKEMIQRALQMFGGNQTRASRYLNLTRRAMSYRMQKYGVTAKSLLERKVGVG